MVWFAVCGLRPEGAPREVWVLRRERIAAPGPQVAGERRIVVGD